jgi:hypothetical protein
VQKATAAYLPIAPTADLLKAPFAGTCDCYVLN